MSINNKTQQLIYQRINKLVEKQQIALQQFWTTKHVCVTIEQFLKMVQIFNLPMDEEQVDKLKKENIQFITLDKLIKNVQLWSKKYQNVGNFFIQSSKPQKNTQVEPSVIDNLIRNSNKSYSAYQKKNNYLIDHKRKQIRSQYILNQTLIRTKNQKNYQMTMKIGQVNDICNRLKNDLSYTITSIGDKIQIKEENKKNNQVSIINEKQFLRKYQAFKHANNNKVDIYQGNLEEDLKQVLIQVMSLTEELERQIKIIQSKDISH